jgi:hypothetical protein
MHLIGYLYEAGKVSCLTKINDAKTDGNNFV